MTLLLGSCKAIEATSTSEKLFNINTFNSAKTNWLEAKKNISKYELHIYTSYWYANFETVVEMENDIMKSCHIYEQSSTPNTINCSTYTTIPSVDEVFTKLKDAYDNNADYITVSYHETYGYPTSFFIDTYTDITDDEVGALIDLVIK